jgi:WD40 repeat protein
MSRKNELTPVFLAAGMDSSLYRDFFLLFRRPDVSQLCKASLLVLLFAGCNPEPRFELQSEMGKGNKEGGRECLGTSHQLSVTCVAFSADGTTLFSAGVDGVVRFWDVASGREIRQIRPYPPGEPVYLAYSPGDATLISAGPNSADVQYWNVSTGKVAGAIVGVGAVDALALSPDERYLAAAGRVGSVELWDRRSGMLLRHGDPVAGEGREFSALAFSPDGEHLAVGDRNFDIYVWQVGKGKSKARVKAHAGGVTCLAWSPDGRFLVSGGRDGDLIVWEPRTMTESCNLKGHSECVWCAAISRDGRWIASGSKDRTIILWNSQSGEKVRQIAGSAGGVVSVAFSPDGKTLASAGGDRMIRLWDVKSGKELRVFYGFRNLDFEKEEKELARKPGIGTAPKRGR